LILELSYDLLGFRGKEKGFRGREKGFFSAQKLYHHLKGSQLASDSDGSQGEPTTKDATVAPEPWLPGKAIRMKYTYTLCGRIAYFHPGGRYEWLYGGEKGRSRDLMLYFLFLGSKLPPLLKEEEEEGEEEEEDLTRGFLYTRIEGGLIRVNVGLV
jgi:hypothetical protein